MMRVYSTSIRWGGSEETVWPSARTDDSAGSASEMIAPHRAAPRQFIEGAYRGSAAPEADTPSCTRTQPGWDPA